jgi:tRNA (guanine-N7-)-methyltransferase
MTAGRYLGGMPKPVTSTLPPRAFFGRRKGHKLRPNRAALLESLLPQLVVDISQPTPHDLRSLFPASVERLAIEIGFGGGENLVREALADPATGFIGCEPFINGMASALAAIEANGLTNIRLHHGDAIEILDWLPDAALARVDLLYPDPWPKKRHHKRRFISEESVARLARVIASGGHFRFASDIDDYTEWTLIRLLRSKDFEWTARRAKDWREPWPGFAATRYEAKAIREGRTPCYLIFRRV